MDQFLKGVAGQPIAVSTESANEQHYAVPPEFFQAVLGKRLKYSCCYWPAGVDSLDEAEAQSLRVTCERAAIEDGMDILELGCGWGSLSLWMAEQFPNCQITSISNSRSQRMFIERRADERGLNNLKVVTADMNDFDPQCKFDRVVSVEMFEHMRNHRKLLDRIHGWLHADGKLFVHIFCHKNMPYLFGTEGAVNWMGRYFFTGGMMPSADLLEQCGSKMRLVSRWNWNGAHYAKTCRAWLNNQDANRDSLRPVLEDTYGRSDASRWHHRWRMFFMACEELFAANGGDDWYVIHQLFEPCPKN